MKQIKVILEKREDVFWAYSNDFEGINGVGDTVEEAKLSADESVEIQKELCNIPNHDFELVFKFDTKSLLN